MELTEAQRAVQTALEAEHDNKIEETLANLEAKEAEMAAKLMPITEIGLCAYLVRCVQPAVTHIHEHLNHSDRAVLFKLLRSARLFDPSFAGQLKMTEAHGHELIENLRVHKALDVDICMGLHIELLSYLIACRKAVVGGLKERPRDILNWHYAFSGQSGIEKVAGRVPALHKRTYEELRKPITRGIGGFRPSFYDAAERLVLVMPTTAIVERIFSMYEARFSKRASRSMGDRIRLELMLAFHKSVL